MRNNRDVERYLLGYPDLQDEDQVTEHTLNLQFYRNEIPSKPNGALISEIHQTWWNDFDLLERHHGYIQVLFLHKTVL
jgi:hypothetical protein